MGLSMIAADDGTRDVVIHSGQTITKELSVTQDDVDVRYFLMSLTLV